MCTPSAATTRTPRRMARAPQPGKPIGTLSAETIRASGQTHRANRPDTRPLLIGAPRRILDLLCRSHPHMPFGPLAANGRKEPSAEVPVSRCVRSQRNYRCDAANLHAASQLRIRSFTRRAAKPSGAATAPQDGIVIRCAVYVCLLQGTDWRSRIICQCRALVTASRRTFYFRSGFREPSHDSTSR